MAKVTGALVCVLMILFVAGCSSSDPRQRGHITVTKTTNPSSDTTTEYRSHSRGNWGVQSDRGSGVGLAHCYNVPPITV